MSWSLLGFGPCMVPPENLAQVVEKGDGETKSDTLRHWRSAEFATTYAPEVTTMFDVLSKSVKDFPDKPFHGRVVEGKGFEWQTYKEVFEQVQAFGSGLVQLDAMKKDSTGEMNLLGLMGRNHSHWQIAEYACFGFKGTTVPFYDSLDPATLTHLINDNELSSVCCDKPSALKLCQAKKAGVDSLQLLIVYATETEEEFTEVANAGKDAGLKVMKFEEVLEAGKKDLKEFTPPTPDTVFSFVFTSGSTGKYPKAALIKHSSMLLSITSVLDEARTTPHFDYKRGEEVHLSFLPIGHAMERTVAGLIISLGGAIGFSRGIREKVMEDLGMLRPTLWPCVPRIMNKLYDKIMSGVQEAGGIKASLFNLALSKKMEGLDMGYLSHPIYDALVFNKLKAKLGLDRCRRIITGSAPIAANVLAFFRAVFGFVVEGYGATEVTVLACGQHAYQFSTKLPGNVGGPCTTCEVRLCSIESMPHYKLSDKKHHGDVDCNGRGEICVRGPAVMREYYKNPTATKEAVDEEGFYHTGDVGCLLPDGTIKIIDRVKNIFKLSNGEYVSPEAVENTLIRAQTVAQMFVHGDRMYARLVGIVVPDPDFVLPLAKQKGWGEELSAICANADFQKHVFDEIKALGKAQGLRGYEIPAKIHLESEAFSPDNGCLTPTFKMQRNNVVAKYKTVLEELLGSDM